MVSMYWLPHLPVASASTSIVKESSLKDLEIHRQLKNLAHNSTKGTAMMVEDNDDKGYHINLEKEVNKEMRQTFEKVVKVMQVVKVMTYAVTLPPTQKPLFRFICLLIKIYAGAIFYL